MPLRSSSPAAVLLAGAILLAGCTGSPPAEAPAPAPTAQPAEGRAAAVPKSAAGEATTGAPGAPSANAMAIAERAPDGEICTRIVDLTAQITKLDGTLQAAVAAGTSTPEREAFTRGMMDVSRDQIAALRETALNRGIVCPEAPAEPASPGAGPSGATLPGEAR